MEKVALLSVLDKEQIVMASVFHKARLVSLFVHVSTFRKGCTDGETTSLRLADCRPWGTNSSTSVQVQPFMATMFPHRNLLVPTR